MRQILKGIYFFLPVQLLLLHFRRYQLLLVFWIVLTAILTGNFAAHFGAQSLFLAPEYLGHMNATSMFLLGCGFCVFVMMWHITTFIIHSKRIPAMGAIRYAFPVYCLNNSVIPVAFLIFYAIRVAMWQTTEELISASGIALRLAGFFSGYIIVLIISFAYFFRVSRDFFKETFLRITAPVTNTMQRTLRYDPMDRETGILAAGTYLSLKLKIHVIDNEKQHDERLMMQVLQRHHRNVVFATFIAYMILLVMGIYVDFDLLRIPAGSSFLLLFSIVLGLVGAFKYFLRSWEALGWILFIAILSVMVKFKIFDLRSIAWGLDYHKEIEQVYHYRTLRSLFSPFRYNADKRREEGRLQKWKKVVSPESSRKPPLVIVTCSGGGSRSAFWTFRVLQYADSLSGGKLFRHTVMITGASGGMIGATYWRNVHDAAMKGQIPYAWADSFQQNIGKDLLNPIVFSFASIDMISPFNKITIRGQQYAPDRGLAFEKELARISGGLLDKPIGAFKDREAAGIIPQLIINATIINDGRKLMMCNQGITYLTQPEYSLGKSAPPIDAVDYYAFFPEQNVYDLRLTSALRMNATFPYILPVVRLPSHPRMNIMDAGLRDNFGIQVAARYLHVLRDWITRNTSEVIFLEIRDTRENDVTTNVDQSSLANMIADPLFVLQNKWEAFQSYGYNYVKDFAPAYVNNKMKFITLQYIPREFTRTAALNFHLTSREKEDIYSSVNHPQNEAEIKKLVKLLQKSSN
jgi:hypothetical protein